MSGQGVGKYLRPFPESPNCGHPLAFVVVDVLFFFFVIGTVGNSFLANFWILDFIFVWVFIFVFSFSIRTNARCWRFAIHKVALFVFVCLCNQNSCSSRGEKSGKKHKRGTTAIGNTNGSNGTCGCNCNYPNLCCLLVALMQFSVFRQLF